MILSRYYLITILIVPILCLGQNTDRKGNFYFNVGPEYRITPIYDSSFYLRSMEANYTNIDLQNSGFALNLGVDYYLNEKLAIGFYNSFRYDMITSGIQDQNSGQGVSKTDKGLLIGYHFDLTYRFDIFRRGGLLVGAGLSLLNRNSEFTVHEPVYDNNDQQIGELSYLSDYKFSAVKVALGYGQGKSRLMLGAYFSGNSNYFAESNTFMIPFLKYSYDFLKL